MKKRMTAALVLTIALAIACTACGKKEDTTPVSSTVAPEATEIPAVTAPPAGEAGGENMLAADDNNAPDAPDVIDREALLASMSEEQRTAEELAGSPVEELYAAIGQPNSSTYSASCMVADGQDGILSYDGFDVATVKYSNGTELVIGTY